MLEYAVSLKTKANTTVIMALTVTTDLKVANEHLAACKRDIANGKYYYMVDAELVMREITPWCEMNTKTIDYKWNGTVTKSC